MPFTSALSYTRADLLVVIARALFPRDFVDATIVANADTSVTTLTLAELYSTAASAQRYVGGFVYAHAGTNSGEWRRVATYNRVQGVSYGAVTVDRPLPSLPDGTTQVAIYSGALSPDDLRGIINEVLRYTTRERTLPVTYVDDGSMEAADTNSWSVVNATRSKVTVGTSVFEGARALRVQNTLANGYAASTSVGVDDNETVRVEAVCRILNAVATTVTATLQLVNSAGTVLASVGTTSRDRVRLSLSEAVPVGTGTVSVRLVGSHASSDIAWDDVVVWKPNETLVTLPVDIVDRTQIVDFYRRRSLSGTPASGSIAAGTAEPYRTDLLRLFGWRVQQDAAVPGRVAVSVARAGSNQLPLMVQVLLPTDELAADTDTVTLSGGIDAFRARALPIAYDLLKRMGPHDERSYYRNSAQESRPGANQAQARGPRPGRPWIRQ